ncbi:methyl-accepting chemotaxis protein [uncultured Thiothrix sp.]|uniref:methyl-accepting chemotaxis protein n=1 Tax=uncultured Thiothrix sp. TaxID=223185 RepID=UPI002628C738|nr:methyl-accepting chemotaxis protein [uncultured Thiothrix sp.]
MSDLTNNKQKVGWLGNMPVAQRIFLLVLIPLLLLLVLGMGAIYVLNKNQTVLKDLSNHIALIDTGNRLIRDTQDKHILLLHEVVLGTKSWEEGLKELKAAEKDFVEVSMPRYKVLKSADKLDDEAIRKEFNRVQEQMDQLLVSIKRSAHLLEGQDRTQLELYVQNDLVAETQGFRDKINAQVEGDIKQSYALSDNATADARLFLLSATILILLGMLIASILGYWIYRSIGKQLGRLNNTIREIAAGDLNARVELGGRSELAELGQAFDGMVEDRIATQRKINSEHQQLNESVFTLLEAVADLSERNLTVRAKVTEDATGPLADAINQLAEDTTDVLKQVREVAMSVDRTSQDVNQHALSVNQLALLERTEAEETAEQLGNILRRLDSIAASAQQANQVADTTSQATREAQESVARTLASISGIRDTVQETGKRLKRLGERSQEISRIIDIISNISERTTVLALNASMQATAAGEAGRGFSVIAEEIQHLAESSRESTDQIGALVRNIQQEANTTIATMDQTISEVVDGSALAEQAAAQMQSSLDATNELVQSVEKIAADSAEQVQISQELQTRAERIVEATQSTGKELLSLTSLTSSMAEAGQRLVKSVNVFKLEA